MVRILFLSANPRDQAPLSVEQECNTIEDRLEIGTLREQFDFQQRHAISIRDLQKVLLNKVPDIVHFSGHGTKESALVFQNENDLAEIVPPDALARLFSVLGSSIQCVVLNSCYSEAQAKAIAKNVGCVVGIPSSISDKTAIDFAAHFYQALGFGRSIKDAFELGMTQLDFVKIPEDKRPVLISLQGTPSDSVLPIKGDIIKGDPIKKGEKIEEQHSLMVFVSKPSALNLQQSLFCSALLAILNARGVKARILGETDYSDLAPLLAVQELMSECDGAIILGMKQIYISECIEKLGTNRERKRNNIFMPTSWNQLEAGMASLTGLPMLILCEDGIEDGIFDPKVSGYYIHHIDISNQKLSIDWLTSEQFGQTFKKWLARVQEHYRKK